MSEARSPEQSRSEDPAEPSGEGRGGARNDAAPPERARRPLRLWPAVVLVVLMVLIRYVAPMLAPVSGMVTGVSGVLGGMAVVVWWLLFSRARWSERVGGLALIAVSLVAAHSLLDESMATGAQGILYFIYAAPLVALAFVTALVLTRGSADRTRRLAVAAAVVFACAAWIPVRTYGVSGGGDWDFDWRWAKSHEERLVERTTDQPAPSVAVAEVAEADWPGFRGPARDGVVRGVRIETDWTASPPVELWRRPIGPGWSSFAVGGDLIYTQEQRGEEELVSCYRASTGEPVWSHADPARFWEAMAGAGPRGTPTLRDGRIYSLGGTGILNVLDAASGRVVWTRNASTDAEKRIPGWGFAGSPLIVGDLVVVAVSGRLVAYDRESGEPRWLGEPHGESYSSPHLLTLDGVEQILLLTGAGVTSVAPNDGRRLWEHAWAGFHSLQPARLDGGDVVFATSGAAGGHGVRRLAISKGPEGWKAEERWTSRGLKPYFNDFVVHGQSLYGFDNSILAAVGVEDGERRWKGGRYGNGQVLLLPDQDLLLVLSERGELALVSAKPDGFEELARIPAIEGKTWNHPVVVDDLVLIRNGREMAAFRLPVI